MVMWYRPADTLFWQLLIGHNLVVKYIGLQAPKLAIERVTFDIGFPVVWMGGRVDLRSRDLAMGLPSRTPERVSYAFINR